jgi:hypothetical protein
MSKAPFSLNDLIWFLKILPREVGLRNLLSQSRSRLPPHYVLLNFAKDEELSTREILQNIVTRVCKNHNLSEHFFEILEDDQLTLVFRRPMNAAEKIIVERESSDSLLLRYEHAIRYSEPV